MVDIVEPFGLVEVDDQVRAGANDPVSLDKVIGLYARSVRDAPERTEDFVPSSTAITAGFISRIDPRYRVIKEKTRAAGKKAAKVIKSAAVKTARKTVKRKKKTSEF